MAVALSTVDGGVANAATITSAGATPGGADRLMLACAIGLSAADDLKSGGSGGTSLTKLGSDQVIFTFWTGSVWQLLPGPTGSTTGWVDFGSGTASAFTIIYLTGADQTTPRTSSQTAGPTTSGSPSLALTGLAAGQDVRVALMVGNLPDTVTGLTPNGSTTVNRSDVGVSSGERQSLTFWLSGVADGSGNVTIGGTLTGVVDVTTWYMVGFGVNAAAAGSKLLTFTQHEAV